MENKYLEEDLFDEGEILYDAIIYDIINEMQIDQNAAEDFLYKICHDEIKTTFVLRAEMEHIKQLVEVYGKKKYIVNKLRKE